MMQLTEIFSYPFMVNAFVVGSLVSVCCALLGVSLVLKRYSMIGDGLSHVSFGALAVGTVMGLAPMKVALPVVIVAAFLLLRISDNSKIKGDAAIALISTGSLAVGVMAVSMGDGINTDISNYLFGSILALSDSDVVMSVVIFAAVLLFFLLFYYRIFAVTFDETFARATGVRTGLYNTLIAVFTALTVVLGLRMMGALLMSALIIFPPLTAMRMCRTFWSVTLCSLVLSLLSFTAGLAMSFLYGTPTGAGIVVTDIVFFLVFAAAAAVRSRRS